MTGKASITPEELARFLDGLRKHKHLTFTEGCRALGVNAATVRYWLDHLIPRFSIERPDLDFSRPVMSGTSLAGAPRDAAAVDTIALQQQVRELNAKLAAYDKQYADQKWIKERLYEMKGSPVILPDWLLRPKKDAKSPGIPETLWSDWHWGEVVRREELGGINEFNIEIAHKRAHALVERTILLLRHYMVHPKYEGIVINLGGDMVSGIIHEELVATNGKAIMAAVVDIWGVLEWALREMADEFGRVVVPCVTGNHGRSTKKTPAKQRASTSFDWLIYMHLQHTFRNDKRITIVAPESADLLYAVYGHRRLLTHGDQFRAGDSIIGPIGPIARGRQKKQSRNTEIGQAFDTMLLGHFHTYTPGDRVIVNGSLKGYDEFAAFMNFGAEDPKQAMWITHPVHGITFHVPVFVDEKRRDKGASAISWVETK